MTDDENETDQHQQNYFEVGGDNEDVRVESDDGLSSYESKADDDCGGSSDEDANSHMMRLRVLRVIS